MHKMMVPMMLIGAAAFGPPAAPGDGVQSFVMNTFAETNSPLYGRPGAYVYNPSGDDSIAFYPPPTPWDLNGDGCVSVDGDFTAIGGYVKPFMDEMRKVAPDAPPIGVPDFPKDRERPPHWKRLPSPTHLPAFFLFCRTCLRK